MSRTGSRGGEAGFTILETVIAMTLLAVLMLSLSGSVGFVGRTWDKGWRSSERSATLAQVEDTMRQLIEGSFPGVTRSLNKERYLFKGDSHGLQLISYEIAGRSAAGYYVSEIVDTVAAGKHRLLYRQQRFNASTFGQSASSPDEVSEVPFLTGSFAFAFSYFGTPRPSAQSAWYESWDYEQRLPELIQLQILEGSSRVWPPIIIRPMVTTDYACVAGTFPGICRSESPRQ